MRKIRIGVLGCAKIAKKSTIPAILQSTYCDLVAVASRSIKKANLFAEQFNCIAVSGYDSLLDMKDIDAVYCPLPTGLHEEWVTKILRAGKHVLVEKSLAADYASCKRLVALAEELGLLIMENFMFTFHSQHATIKNILDSDEIGEIRSFRSSFGFPPLNKDNFRYDQKLGGGALLDAAAYTIKASQLFLGYKLEVFASTLITPLGYEVDVFGGAYLQNKDGQFAQLSFGFDNFYQCNYEIWGSKGKLINTKAFTPNKTHKPLVIIEKQDETKKIFLDSDNHFLKIIDAFAERILLNINFNEYYNEVLNQSKLIEQVRKKSDLWVG